ncbi:MAG: hypothetical protein P4M09_04195 [Devosia sp.]|nr:hypothetical protein [Devosia sp.]
MTKNEDEYGDEDTAKRRDEVLKRMLNTPPKPHATRPQSRVGNRKKADAGSPAPGRGKSDPEA